MRTFRAHFDGTYIVPDEVTDLVAGEEIEVTVVGRVPRAELSVAEKRAAFNRFLSFATPADIPDEALRRESIYEDRR